MKTGGGRAVQVARQNCGGLDNWPLKSTCRLSYTTHTDGIAVREKRNNKINTHQHNRVGRALGGA